MIKMSHITYSQEVSNLSFEEPEYTPEVLKKEPTVVKEIPTHKQVGMKLPMKLVEQLQEEKENLKERSIASTVKHIITEYFKDIEKVYPVKKVRFTDKDVLGSLNFILGASLGIENDRIHNEIKIHILKLLELLG